MVLLPWPPPKSFFAPDSSVGLICRGLSDKGVPVDFSNRPTMSRTDRSDTFRPEDGPLLARLDEKLWLSPCRSIFLSRMRSGQEGEPLSWLSLRGELFPSIAKTLMPSLFVRITSAISCRRCAHIFQDSKSESAGRNRSWQAGRPPVTPSGKEQ